MSRSATDRGYLLVDRHVEKNAGSTYRELLFQAESRGLCMYWGFQLRSVIWSQVLDRLPSLDTPLRLCIEAHSYIDYGIPWRRRLRQRKTAAARSRAARG